MLLIPVIPRSISADVERPSNQNEIDPHRKASAAPQHHKDTHEIRNITATSGRGGILIIINSENVMSPVVFQQKPIFHARQQSREKGLLCATGIYIFPF